MSVSNDLSGSYSGYISGYGIGFKNQYVNTAPPVEWKDSLQIGPDTSLPKVPVEGEGGEEESDAIRGVMNAGFQYWCDPDTIIEMATNLPTSLPSASYDTPSQDKTWWDSFKGGVAYAWSYVETGGTMAGAFGYIFFISGPYNIMVGAAGMVQEIVCCDIDVMLGLVTLVTSALGSPVVPEPWSGTLQGLEHGDISAGGFYGNVALNFFTLGTYGQVSAYCNWFADNLTDAQMQQQVGEIAALQLFPAAVKYGPKVVGKMVTRAPRTVTELGETPRVIPKESYPKPPKWSEEWTWEPASGEEYAPQWRWWDPEGGEWRYHFPDKHHSVGHWDYNPWNHPCSQWQTIPDPNWGVTPP